MGQSVLAYQFVVGLGSELKSKLVGREGSFEQLLEVACFEEARIRKSATEGMHFAVSLHRQMEGVQFHQCLTPKQLPSHTN